MWILELNVAGYHVTRVIPDLPRPDLPRRRFWFARRPLSWPAGQTRPPHAA